MVRTPTSGSSGNRFFRTGPRGLRPALFALIATVVFASGVAAVFGEGADEDRGKVVGAKTCFLCHQPMKESFPKSIHGGLYEDEKSVACETCHGPGERHATSMGETKYIIRFADLTPEAASKRCLACHSQTAPEGSHIRGFLDSKWLAEGKSCLACHRAHAPAEPAAAGAKKEPAPSPMVGSDTCLMCHQDRPENVRFPHRDRVADMMGCETCHGPGREHAVNRGKGPIRNPAKMDPPKANASCLLCHSDKAPPEHFEPKPGKNTCSDCHSIHVAPEGAEAAAAPEHPGRPTFRLDAAAAAPVPAPMRNPFVEPSVPMPEEEGVEFAGLRLAGEIRGGYRATSVDGNERVYDQDLNYDSGFRLFDFSLAGALADRPDVRFAAEASGVDDPVEHYSLEAQYGSLVRFDADVTRTNFVYHASGDPFDQSSRKNMASFSLSVAPEGELRFSAGLDLWNRDARRRTQRLVEFAKTAVTEPIDEESWYAWVRAEWTHGPFTVSATQGYRSESLDRGIDTVATPTLPTDRSIFYTQETDLKAPVTTLLGSFKPSSAITVDGKVVYSPIDNDTSVYDRTTGPGTGAGYVEEVFGDVNGERNFFRAEVGGTWYATDELSVSARFENLLSLEQSTATTRTVRTEPTGGTPVTDVTSRRIDRDQRIWRGSVEGRYRAADWISVRAGYELGYEEFDINYDVGDDDFWDTTFLGPVLGLDLDPIEGLSIEAQYRFVHVADPDVPIGEENLDQAKIRARYRIAHDLTVTGFVTERYLTNGIRDTEIRSFAAGLGATLTPRSDLTVDLGWNFQSFDTQADVLRFFSGVPVEGTSEFEGRTNGLYAFGDWTATEDLILSAGASWYHTTGDFPTDLIDLTLGAEYRVHRHASVGTNLRWISYDEDDSNVDDYDAFLAELWVKLRF